jgi:alkylated DNA repair dioxygenase AlkB
MNLLEEAALFPIGEPNEIVYDLIDADVILYPQFFRAEEANKLYNTLLQETAWQQDEIKLYNKQHLIPRLNAWYGDINKSYTYSNIKMKPHPWTENLYFIKDQVDRTAGVVFTNVLLNLYRTGMDSMGWHRDNEKKLGENPIIASVSFGATRPFQLRHKFRKDLKKTAIPLTHGSLLLMRGTTQHCWEHCIPKTTKQIDSRINLTFRIIKV